MIDETDLKIIDMLKINSKISLKKIGEHVHLTPQGVSNRILRLEDSGVITQYTIYTNNNLLGKNITGFITVFMKTPNHDKIVKLAKISSIVTEAHRISGDGCYLLKIMCSDMDEINSLLDNIVEYGTYRLSLSTSAIKD